MPAKNYFKKEVGFNFFRENSRKRQLGFTLIELLIVIVIISILIMFLFVSFTQVQKNSRDAQRKSDLQTIAAALQRFHSDYGYYPVDAEDGNIAFWCGGALTNEITIGGQFSGITAACATNGIIYLKQLPQGPLSNDYYHYSAYVNINSNIPDEKPVTGCKTGPTSQSLCQSYVLWASLENLSTPIPGCPSPPTSGPTPFRPFNYCVTPND